MSIHLEPGTVVESPAASLPVLANLLRGRLATHTDADWDAARTAWNLAVDQRPAAVAFPVDAADVAVVLAFAAAHGLRVAPQSGGHNPGPLGDLSRTILLRTTEMRRIAVDVANRSVRVGAGVLWGEVTAALAPHGLVALSGSSPDVGVSGYTLNGGYSWLGRRHGLAANQVRSAEVVTGDARVLRVDAGTEPDLFWAVRGGGGNGLVVTELEFGVLPLDTVYAGSLLFGIDRAAEICAAFADWTLDLDESATVCLRLLHLPPLPELPEFLRGKAFVGVDGAIDADPERAAALLAPIRDLGPAVDTFGPMPAAELGTIHMDPPVPVPAAGHGFILDELGPETIDALLSVAGPQARTALLAVDLRLLGGALGRRVDGGGVVDHLPGRYLAFAVGITPVPPAKEAVERDLRALTSALAPWTNARSYANFDESAGGPDRFHTAEVLQRLRAVVRHVDPAGVIQPNHPLD
ncbi:FAD-binding oxidoreductase [Nakamurella lactea]|uniref:FAD-binding oxidoreductase n=1 Tax=Nakamurella lactea TaxID=459515 RepID=UPI000426DFFD|nr:FAD-binding oxidoreductase [Nakamurella lactea]